MNPVFADSTGVSRVPTASDSSPSSPSELSPQSEQPAPSSPAQHSQHTVTTAHPAVVLCLSPTGLAVARSLAPRGVAVYGSDPATREIGHYSRWVQHDPRFSTAEPGPELLEGLLAWGAEQSHRPVIFIAGDAYIDFVSDHRDALSQHFILAKSMRREVNSLFTNKRTFYERCESEGVGMPRTFFPKDDAEAQSAADTLRYPAIVKPTLGHLFRRKLKGEKLVEVDSPSDLLRWWRQFRDWGGESVLQEVIEGPEANIFVAGMYTDEQGDTRSIFTARKTRQYPPMYGSGSFMEACWSEEIADLSIDLIRRLGYTGICGTEYKWDERDDAWKLIEVNTRPTLWFSLTRAAGVDVIWDAYCDLIGQPNPVHANCQDDRVRWQLPVRDLVSGLHFLREGSLGFGAFLRTVIDPRRKDFGDVSLRDPGTLIGLPANTLYKYMHNVRGEEQDEGDE